MRLNLRRWPARTFRARPGKTDSTITVTASSCHGSAKRRGMNASPRSRSRRPRTTTLTSQESWQRMTARLPDGTLPSCRASPRSFGDSLQIALFDQPRHASADLRAMISPSDEVVVAMASSLVAKYEENGFIFLPGLLSQAEVGVLALDLEEILAGEADPHRVILEKDGTTPRTVPNPHIHRDVY